MPYRLSWEIKLKNNKNNNTVKNNKYSVKMNNNKKEIAQDLIKM